MMVMWSSHTGRDDPSGVGVTDYLCSSIVWKPTGKGGRDRVVRTPAPEVLRGDPWLMRRTIEAVPFQCKYSSAVLSFALEDVDVAAFNAGDRALRQQARDVITQFEQSAFSGIPEEHWPLTLWTTHTHAGRLELNVCIPRVLITGKGEVRSFNPHPPGLQSRAFWDSFRDIQNCRHGWADPEDPARARLVSVPNWIAKVSAEVRRAGKTTRPHVSQAICAYMEEAIRQGMIHSREDLIGQLLAVPGIASIRRRGVNYITLVTDQGVAIRLRGKGFSEDFTSLESLPKA